MTAQQTLQFYNSCYHQAFVQIASINSAPTCSIAALNNVAKNCSFLNLEKDRNMIIDQVNRYLEIIRKNQEIFDFS